MTHLTTPRLLHAAWYTPGLNGRWGLPILFEGPPGVGKSRIIEYTGESSGLDVRTVIASISEPADFSGLPVPGDRDGQTCVNYAPPSWAMDLKNAVVFMDEITTCPPAVQAALLRVILDGTIGQYKLPETVRFVSACNPVDLAAGGWDLAPPLANRFGHRVWDAPEAEGWANWLVGSDVDEDVTTTSEAEQKRVLKRFPEAFAKAKGMMSAFIRARPELLHKMPQTGDAALGRAWCSPRSWEMAVRASAGSEVHDFNDVEHDEYVSCFVGSAAVAELRTFISENDLPNPADVLDGKVKFKHDARRLDRTAAVLSGCAALVTAPNADKVKPRVSTLWGLIADICGTAADVTVPAARALVQARQLTDAKATKALGVLHPILEAAGVRTR